MPDSIPRIPMLSNKVATAAGIPPVPNKPVRFAVGDPNGLSSNCSEDICNSIDAARKGRRVGEHTFHMGRGFTPMNQ